MSTKLNAMTIQELQAICKSFGLTRTGKKAELVTRISEYMASHPDAKIVAVSENEAIVNTPIDTPKEEDMKPEVNQSAYAVNAMRGAIIAAHQTNNKKAIDRVTAIAGGATDERYDQWVLWVDSLRDTVCEYVKLKHLQKTTQQQLDSARGAIFPRWRNILRVGEESRFHRNMFVRKEDIDSLVGFCERFIATDRGTQMTCTTKMIFRKYVESLLGCRIAGNALLSDADRDDILTYGSATKTVESTLKRLEGYYTDDGNHVEGIKQKISTLEKILAKNKETLERAKHTPEEIAELTAGDSLTLKQLQKDKQSAEKTLKEAKETVNRLKDRVDRINDTLNLINPDDFDR